MNNTRAVIFVNGEIRKIESLRVLLQADDLIIAADGGLRHVLKLGKWPQVLIGDLDSVLPEEVEQAREAGVEIKKFPAEKNETDLQLALDFALKAGCFKIIIAGALGGRLDHTLGNIFLLTRPDLRDIDIRLDDGHEAVFLIRSAAEITGEPGDMISLLPYGDPAIDVKTENLRYPLAGETLYPQQTRGISNVMGTSHARITLSAGLLICIHTRKTIPVTN